MPNLESFLNNEKKSKGLPQEPASGSFNCQEQGCDEKVFEGYIDRENSRLHWTCSKGHDSSVVI